jgi:hypothetical protein
MTCCQADLHNPAAKQQRRGAGDLHLQTKAQAGGTQVAFSGGGTPEPERLLGLLLLAMTLVGIGLRLRRRTAPG